MRLANEARELLREQVDYREVLIRMTMRDLKLRYKQTAMGFGWALFMPLINTVIFSVIFTRVAPIDTAVPYPVFAYCGLVVWNFFASSLRFAIASLTSNTSLVTKVYFPREILPFSAVFVCLIDFAVAAIGLAALMVYYEIPPSPALVLLPAVIAVHVVLTAAIALALAMANLFYRDVKYLFEVVVNVWMFATPVVYPADLVGGRLGALLQLNPMTPVVDAYRAVLLRGELPPAGPFATVAVVAVAALAGAWLTFHRAEFAFAENA